MDSPFFDLFFCGRADVGSELSAASGGYSEVSEWPRSKFPAYAVKAARKFWAPQQGHRPLRM